jgi:hypothetical protein
MMWRPFGKINPPSNTPNYHDIVLSNWAKLTGVDIGRGEGWAGTNFFVTAEPVIGFCIDSRGPEVHAAIKGRFHFPFDRHNRNTRRAAFKDALAKLEQCQQLNEDAFAKRNRKA